MNWNFEFHSPWYLLIFLLFIPLIIKDLKKKNNQGVKIPFLPLMKSEGNFNFVLWLLRMTKYFFLSCIVIALARPRTYTISTDREEGKGLDIMLSVDVSLSMLARDLEPDRMTALKKIAKEFVKKRPNDRIGLVAYSGEAMTKVPVTFDHQVVEQEISALNSNELLSGTSIGDGLAVAVSHLKESKAKGKIIILMTDGVNTIENAMPPMVAAQLAQNNGIKVYTIGIGTNGQASMPTSIDIFGDLIFENVQVTIDEPILREIASQTGGRYFRATSNESLQSVYEDINKLEKSNLKMQTNYHYKEFFIYFLWLSVLVLFFDALLRWVFYRILM